MSRQNQGNAVAYWPSKPAAITVKQPPSVQPPHRLSFPRQPRVDPCPPSCASSASPLSFARGASLQPPARVNVGSESRTETASESFPCPTIKTGIVTETWSSEVARRLYQPKWADEPECPRPVPKRRAVRRLFIL